MADLEKARFETKVVLITGGTQGLGEAVARRLADRGASGLAICGRNEERGERVAAELSAAGSQALFVRTELEQEADCRQAIRRCDEEFGRIDGLVNAAATTERGSLEDSSAELWDRIMAINLRAPFLLMQEAVRVMKREGRGGSIVNILSMSAHGGQPFLTPYSVSKGALATLTKNAAHSLRNDRIRVNGLNIGWMASPGEQAVQRSEGQPDNWLETADARMPFGRILRPDDVASMTTYLLSDEAEMMTGALVDFDQHVSGIYDP